MSESDYRKLEQFNWTLHTCNADPTCNSTQLRYHNITFLEDVSLPGDGSPGLRTAISVVYGIVCALGLTSNLLVLYVLHSSRTRWKCTINFFVFNLAITDLLFSMVQPFWTVDVALDYSWPFGWCMCKVISLLTALNVYAGTFFLTAMSVARYCSVVTALKPARPQARKICLMKLVTCLIWSGALLAAAPSVIFSTVSEVGGDQLCLLRFPEGTFWLGVHHLLRVTFGFLLPYTVLIVFYLLLLRFLCNHKLRSVSHHRQSRVSRSVAVVVLSFCICWFPFNVITFWGILIKLDVLELTSSFYVTHTYIFPLATCLAHTNSCLNPIIYCLVRKEFRKELKKILCRPRFWNLCKTSLAAMACSKDKTQEHYVTVPLPHVESQTVHSHTKSFTYVTSVSSPRNSAPLAESGQ
ncbi:relaxin-3 receptor 1-like [Scleropages formosus]|uniref:relaxin-3 receptor 1-like n=1 Tax=Scleropages formosus TaxID=113540 RepID=UPI000878B97D|nr:relaxin-3 receptor 1-like [Scleropages formosus]